MGPTEDAGLFFCFFFFLLKWIFALKKTGNKMENTMTLEPHDRAKEKLDLRKRKYEGTKAPRTAYKY